MPAIPADLIQRFAQIQPQIWQTVSLTMSEASNAAANLGSPLPTAVSPSELYSEMTTPMLVIQFSFANLPENSQIVLIPQQTFGQVAAMLRGAKIAEIDENLLAEVRGPVEAIVQGICMAVGNNRNEAAVASGLTIRYQIFSFPPNLQRLEELMRVQVALEIDDVSGTLLWLLDPETMAYVSNVDPVSTNEESTSAFAQFAAGPAAASAPSSAHHEESNGLDFLMDIPLEISVELGRVKMLVRDVVELGTGSIVEIEKAAGEPVDVMVNGRLVAKGEVVVVEDNFGVRITEILTPQERLMRLGDVA